MEKIATGLDLNRLEALAHAATAGARKVRRDQSGKRWFVELKESESTAPAIAQRVKTEADAKLFAALDPKTVSELVALARRAI